MLVQSLTQIDKGKRTAAAVIIEGSGSGSRCIWTEDRFVFEDYRGTHKKELAQFLKEELVRVEETCSREFFLAEEKGKVFFEIWNKNPRLVVCGGGHVAAAMIRLARFLHISTTVIEDRPLFANHAREAGADEVVCDSFEHGLKTIDGDEDTYFVIVTRGHRFDKVCLEAVLHKKYGYVGMMGSRSRIRLLKKAMEEEGYSMEQLGQLHAPIGLDIKSETPEEIAVSIMGEIIEVKNSQKRTEGFSDEIMEGMQISGKKVLATIVMRKGSAPRQIGTKMLILSDGTTRGTIGGGCAEAELLRTARLMLAQEESMPKTVQVNMTNQSAEEEGMVCGGIQDIFLEIID